MVAAGTTPNSSCASTLTPAPPRPPHHCIASSQKLVRPVAAGTSGQLKFSLEDTGIVSGERYEEYVLGDPSEEAARRALEARGYDAQAAADIVESCGVRLRMLEGPLTGPHRPAANEFIAQREAKVWGQFRSVLAALGPSDAKAAAKLLDDIAAAEAGGAAPPAFTLIPPAVKAADFSRVTFIDSSGNLTFQSRVHSRVWQQERDALMAGQGTGPG